MILNCGSLQLFHRCKAWMSLDQLSADICHATEGAHVEIYRQSSRLNHQFHALRVCFSVVFVSRLRRRCQLKPGGYLKAIL